MWDLLQKEMLVYIFGKVTNNFWINLFSIPFSTDFCIKLHAKLIQLVSKIMQMMANIIQMVVKKFYI